MVLGIIINILSARFNSYLSIITLQSLINMALFQWLYGILLMPSLFLFNLPEKWYNNFRQ